MEIILNKFWKYQQILRASSYCNKASIIHPCIYVFLIIIYHGIFNDTGMTFGPITMALLSAYFTINSKRCFEILPVSKPYILVNIYLEVLIISLSIALFLILIFNYIFGVTNLISYYSDWRTISAAVSVSVIMACILLPVFFLKNSVLRKILSITIVSIFLIIVRLFKDTLPAIAGKIDFLESIKLMPHYNELALTLACISIVIIPVSMFTAYRLFNGKRCI